MGRRGPRKQKGKREPNGRLSRDPAIAAARHLEALDLEERAAIAVGLEARQRVFGIVPRLSRDQAREDSLNDVRRWLEERSGTPSFNEVRVAFMADWLEPAVAGQGQAVE